jgi:RNA polymerase sigma-70 factor (ECF subfamily)
MKPAVTQPPAAPPGDSVRAALDDATQAEGLLKHALAILARRLAGRPASDRLDKAREAFQETCVRALQKQQDYDPTGPVGAWLHGIMVNVLFEATRSLGRLPAQEPVAAAAWEEIAVDFASGAADSVSTRLDVAACLAKLSSEHREVLQLRFKDGLSHDEIAVRLGISPGNARVRLCRALSAAREIAGAAPREDRP